MFESSTVLVIAPHPDDETLGCGGTLLRLSHLGVEVHWLLVTNMSENAGYSASQVEKRDQEIADVSRKYPFHQTHRLEFEPATLDSVKKGELISAISHVVNQVKPDLVLTPYRNDAHSDHEVVYDATMAATKTFRYPFIKRVLAYETISETDFGLKPEDGGFRPNVYVDISNHIEKKLEILEIFESEMGDFPFPRSRKAIESLAFVRGAQCNKNAAEAFMLIKEVS